MALAAADVRTRATVELRTHAHGAWLLPSVATQGLALNAAAAALTHRATSLAVLAAAAWCSAYCSMSGWRHDHHTAHAQGDQPAATRDRRGAIPPTRLPHTAPGTTRCTGLIRLDRQWHQHDDPVPHERGAQAPAQCGRDRDGQSTGRKSCRGRNFSTDPAGPPPPVTKPGHDAVR